VSFSIFSMAWLEMESSRFECFSWNLENTYKIVENSKNCKRYFVVLFVTRTTTYAKHVEL
jgi:hypothetical protein